jgi:hypothetical protein
VDGADARVRHGERLVVCGPRAAVGHADHVAVAGVGRDTGGGREQEGDDDERAPHYDPA